MKQGYANNDKDRVSQAARCWLQLEPENPFNAESPEYEEFFQMQKCFTIWKRGDIDRKINGRKMIEHAWKLCELNPRQPYKFDKATEDAELKQTQEVEKKRVEEAVNIVEEEKEEVKSEYVFGVLPEEKKNWLSFLFPWKKDGVTHDGK